jgi:carbamoyltransferase
MNGTIQLGIYGIHDISKGENPILIHDHNLAVYTHGRLQNYIHLERYTRKKFDASLSYHIEQITRDLGLAGKRNIELCFVDHELGKAFVSSEGRIRFEGSSGNALSSDLHEGTGYWFGERIPAYWLSHEVAHLYSCIPFYGGFRENSLLIHYDGGASVSNFSAWVYRAGHLTQISSHYKLKWLTNLFNANALVFKLTGTVPKYHNSVPGKFMGLSSFGTYKPDLEEWLDTNKYFFDIWASPNSFLAKLAKDWNITIKTIDNHHPFLQDIAATIHEIFIRESLKEILYLQKSSACKILYFTGGCALSIKLNSVIRDSKVFDEIYIPPCTNDSGLSIGAAVALSMEKGYIIQKEGPYIGSMEAEEPRLKDSTNNLEKIAGLINDYKIIGVCNGKSETGPRALGNRSIIARADSKILAEKISRKIKGREWYRPVAPVMLPEHARYVTGQKDFPISAQYMLYDFDISKERSREIEGVVHVDGTSRIQILENREQNPFLFDLLKFCSDNYGLRALINTSFNLKGEPIVQTFEQAMKSARKMKLDGLVLNGELVNF